MKTIAGTTLYEIPDLSAALGIHPVTARRYLAEGRIPARKMGKAWLVAEETLRGMFEVKTFPSLCQPESGGRKAPRSARRKA